MKHLLLLMIVAFMAVNALDAMWDKRTSNTYAFPEVTLPQPIEEIPIDHPYNDPACCGGCYQLYVHYEPCCYPIAYWQQDYIPCQKHCCRYIDRYYEVTRHRWVPQYYTATIVQREPEHYVVDEMQPCMRKVNETISGYVPQYYWKPVCDDCCCIQP